MINITEARIYDFGRNDLSINIAGLHEEVVERTESTLIDLSNLFDIDAVLSSCRDLPDFNEFRRPLFALTVFIIEQYEATLDCNIEDEDFDDMRNGGFDGGCRPDTVALVLENHVCSLRNRNEEIA